MFGSYGFILYILYIPVQKSLRPYGYWWSEVDNQKSKNAKNGLRNLNALGYHYSIAGLGTIRFLVGVLNVSSRST